MYICFSVKLYEVLCCVTLKVIQRQSQIVFRCALGDSNSNFKVTRYLLQGTGGEDQNNLSHGQDLLIINLILSVRASAQNPRICVNFTFTL